MKTGYLSEMEIRDLDKSEQAALIDGLKLAAKLSDTGLPLSLTNIQELYDALNGRGNDFPEGTIACGLAFGQLIVDQTGFDWVRVNDEYGEATCVSPSGAKLICSPVSMIQKRLSRGESLNLKDLKNEVINSLAAKLESGDYDTR